MKKIISQTPNSSMLANAPGTIFPRLRPNKNPTARLIASGFTLIELMIVVAVIGIIAAIALPSYQESVRKSRRASAKAALLELASREERFYSTNNSYATNLTTSLGYSTSPLSIPDANNTFYSVTVGNGASGNAQSYIATATAVGSQVKDTCGNFTLDNLGVKGNTSNSTPTLNCW